MAKRREQKDEAESKEFEIPKFNKEKFITKEKEKIKATFISFGFAVLIALISFGFWVLLQDSQFQWTLVILFGIFSASWIQYLFKQFSIDMDHIEKKGMFSSFAIYLFTWLFILIVLVNPPFYDAEPPQINMVTLPDMQEPGGTVKIVAHITDNSGIQNNQAQLQLMYGNQTVVDKTITLNDNILLYEFENTENQIGSFNCKITTMDVSGQQKIKQTEFTYSEDTLKLPSPDAASTPPGPTITYADELAIDVKADVDQVYYTVNTEDGHSATINATKPTDEYYRTTPKMKGWKQNANTTISLFAKCIHYFPNDGREFNNTIQDNSTYYVVTSDAAEIGSETPPTISLPKPNFVQVPGFELLVFIISIIGVLFIIKRKRSGRNKKP
ncbi:MAG: hypothetical protein KGY50_03935 [Candidatus Thermoplasmatota archaeon]|nr:hypothetical protein [Candidatus Thermoplasmatota archaeon]